MSVALRDDNYYSQEADEAYMSASQLKGYRTCEAMQQAKVEGRWSEEPSEAMLAGSYVHAAMESEEALNKFTEENHDNIFNKKGNKYAVFMQADKMIETLQTDEMVMSFLSGQKEHIIVVEMFGVLWKAKLDDYVRGKRISDIKTCASLDKKVWSQEEGRHIGWVEANRYTTQMALYAEAERISSGRKKWLDAYIIAVTKEEPPDKAVISIDHDTIAHELEQVKAIMPRIIAVKNGLVEPTRCECCKYCRATKKVTRVMAYQELIV